MDGPPAYHHRLATGTIVFQCVRCPIQALHSKYTGIRTRLTRFVHRAPMKAHCSPERTTRAAERSRQNNARIFAKAPLPVHTPVHPILQLQQNIGNRAVQRLIQSRTIRAQALQRQPADPDPFLPLVTGPAAGGTRSWLLPSSQNLEKSLRDRVNGGMSY